MPFSYLIVLLTPIKGCCCVSPVTIIPGVKVQWRHFYLTPCVLFNFPPQGCQTSNVVVCPAGPVYQYVLHCYLSLWESLALSKMKASQHNISGSPRLPRQCRVSQQSITTVECNARKQTRYKPISGRKFPLQICASKHGESL